MIHCPNCGELSNNDIEIYNANLRRQQFSLSPILPVCKSCGAEVLVSHVCNGGKVIVLNGTCGSGKSTVAEALVEKGFMAIDGDCVIQCVRHKTGKKAYEWSALIDEIICEMDILSLFTQNIVLSHIVLPEELDKYIALFEARNLQYEFFLLKPEYHAAVERCQTRTCHTSITEERWIRHFYDVLVFDSRVAVIDNTNMTADETAEYILKMRS